MPFYVTSDISGQITQFRYQQQELFDLVPEISPDYSVMQVEALPMGVAELTLRYYVDANTIRPRTPIEATVSTSTIAADGIDACDISGLPMPCTASIGGVLTMALFVVDDGTLSITSDTPGEIVVTVTAAPPWLEWSTTIYAT